MVPGVPLVRTELRSEAGRPFARCSGVLPASSRRADRTLPQARATGEQSAVLAGAEHHRAGPQRAIALLGLGQQGQSRWTSEPVLKP